MGSGLGRFKFKKIRISFSKDKKNITSEIGEMLFTHFGVSGPLILELSSKIADWLQVAVQ
jgi:Predicted flavoproteins